MDSGCAVRDLTTAPRLGAFGLTRWRLPPAVELEDTLNSQIDKHQPSGVRGLPLIAMGGRSQKSIEFFAGRVKRALFLLGETAMDQWPLIVGNGLTDQLLNRSLSEFGRIVEVSDDLAPEQPQVVAVQITGFARQTLGQQVQQERREHRHDLLTRNYVTLLATPTCRPSRQIRAVGGQV